MGEFIVGIIMNILSHVGVQNESAECHKVVILYLRLLQVS